MTADLTRIVRSWLTRLAHRGGGGRAQPAAALYVIAAPSGAGKTSLVKAVVGRVKDLDVSVSYTTRAKRDSEEDGVDYFFVDKSRFEAMREADEFLESADVFDNRYGTARATVRQALAAGKNVLLEIDWQGARQVRRAMPECQAVFILPPSRRALEERLRLRRTDTDEVIARRLRDSVSDMGHWEEFDFVVVNDDFDTAVDDLCAIVAGRGDRLRSDRAQLAPLLADLLAT